MKVLTRVFAVLAVVLFGAPALACSDMMHQTTAEKKVEQPAVASKTQQPQTSKSTAKAQTKTAKQKVAAN